MGNGQLALPGIQAGFHSLTPSSFLVRWRGRQGSSNHTLSKCLRGLWGKSPGHALFASPASESDLVREAVFFLKKDL